MNKIRKINRNSPWWWKFKCILSLDSNSSFNLEQGFRDYSCGTLENKLKSWQFPVTTASCQNPGFSDIWGQIPCVGTASILGGLGRLCKHTQDFQQFKDHWWKKNAMILLWICLFAGTRVWLGNVRAHTVRAMLRKTKHCPEMPNTTLGTVVSACCIQTTSN